ncbi:MAG: hypothetical protein QW100_02250 [Thermoplasmatales archaeon]
MASRDVFAGAVVVLVYLVLWAADAVVEWVVGRVVGRYRRGRSTTVS